MARALIVACGCRGRELGAELRAHGWQVRGTSRSEARSPTIEAAGLEFAAADPDRPGTILDQVGDVSVVVYLLGSALGDRDLIESIHGPRLERLLERLVDTPVRGFAYEASGGVDGRLLGSGREMVERAAQTWRIPVAFLAGERDEAGWAQSCAATVSGLLDER